MLVMAKLLFEYIYVFLRRRCLYLLSEVLKEILYSPLLFGLGEAD